MRFAVTLDPRTRTEHLRLHMSKAGTMVKTYRVYRRSEADVEIPLTLP